MNPPTPPDFPLSRRDALRLAAGALAAGALPTPARAVAAEAPPRSFNGIYPHLATQNRENECGTGAVVPWAGKLWAISYGPHLPRGSSDRLYEIEPGTLRRTVRPESVGGTPANQRPGATMEHASAVSGLQPVSRAPLAMSTTR